MKQLVVLVFGLLIAAVSVEARLGESIEKCKARYGDPVRESLNDELTGIAIYTKNDLTITIHFRKGQSDLIRYSPGQVSTVDFDLAKYLLQLNGRSKEWEQLTKTEVVLNEIRDQNAQYPRIQLVDPILWKSKDGILDASYSVSKGVFEVKSSAYQDQIKQGL